MATLYVTEYVEMAKDASGRIIPAGQEPAIATQTVAIGGSSTQSSAFNAKTKFIRVANDTQVCSIAFGANPTATASSQRMAARQRRILQRQQNAWRARQGSSHF